MHHVRLRTQEALVEQQSRQTVVAPGYEKIQRSFIYQHAAAVGISLPGFTFLIEYSFVTHVELAALNN